MEVKIVCGCGQKYKFDIEPVNGRMPVPVHCPVCKAEGTAAANEILSRTVQPPPLPMTPASQSSTPPPQIAIAGPPGGGLRINRPAPAPAVVSPPPALAAPAAIAPLAAAGPKPKKTGEYSLAMGILGAVLGAGLGAALMYAFFLWAQFRFPLMGTCIGALSGLGARVFARGTEVTLGVITGGIALVSTAGTLYLMFGDLAVMFFISMIVSVFFAYRIAG